MKNREIKFRVWDKERKIFVPISKLSTDIDNSTITGIIQTWSGKALSKHQVTLMQYTGLKDKEGKEAYEGDIIIWTHPNDEFPLTHEVEFNNDLSSYMLGGSYLYEADEIEIIGNIYQNPELLEK